MGQKLWPWALGTSYFFTALVLIQVIRPVLPLPTKLDRTSTELTGWRELGEKAGEFKRGMPDPGRTFLFGLRYQTASELAFYVPGKPQTVSINRWKRPNVYDYWWQDKDLLGMDAVGVTFSPDSHKTKLNRIFERVDPPVEIKIFRKIHVKSFYLDRAYGFKGGLKWLPPGGGDIRAGKDSKKKSNSR